MKTKEEAHHYRKQRLSVIWVIGILLFAWSCQTTSETTPSDVLPEDKMAEVLTEIHLAEAKASKLGVISADSTTLIYKRLESQIYKKHKIDTAAYFRSYRYYSSNPAKMADVYKQVTEKLQIQDSLQRLKAAPTPTPKKDSLSKKANDSLRVKPSLKKLKLREQLKIERTPQS
ncbi:DUF4296 domain-containing protein [Tellurirhabdus bombi]|uniref:DUF4296 domain-containing protein n=1 Tax=Tellurirhabdus bombi TaxID=2907205 RepID=UPI001F3C3CED|nr:DUF4296 domain-containing protein [Tellurirhabdus bombi]